MPTAVPTNVRNYIEYRLVKRHGVFPESLPMDSADGNIVVEDTEDHWLLRMDLDQHEQGFFHTRTTIW